MRRRRDDRLQCLPCPRPLTSPFEETHGGGRRKVERLHLAGDRYPNRRVGQGAGLLGQAARFVAEHQRDRIAREIRPIEVLDAVGGHGVDPEAPVPEFHQRGLGIGTADDRDVEERPGRCANGLRVVGIHRCLREDHPARSSGVGGTQDRPCVAGVTNLVEHGDAAIRREGIQPAVQERRHADQALRRDRGCQLAHHVIADHLDHHAALAGADRQRLQVIHHEEAHEGAGVQCLAHALRTFHQEGAVLIPERTLLEPQDGGYLRVLD